MCVTVCPKRTTLLTTHLATYNVCACVHVLYMVFSISAYNVHALVHNVYIHVCVQVHVNVCVAPPGLTGCPKVIKVDE